MAVHTLSALVKLRPRDSNKIVRDAARMAAKKLASGCQICGNAYLELARQHGGTETEILRIARNEMEMAHLEPVAPKAKIHVPKARIALPAAAVAATTSGSTARAAPRKKLLPGNASERPVIRIDPFGVDGSTTVGAGTAAGMPLNFYVGELGFGTCSNCGPCGGACFNTGTANYVGINFTYGYWGLEGPTLAPSGRTAYQWGQDQGNAAINAWLHGPFAPYVFGQTIFADIERGFGGWVNSNYGPNQDVLNGYIDAIATTGAPYGLTPGVYISEGDINGPNNFWFAASYVSSRPFVYWVTGRKTCAPCAPCSTSCNTITDVQNRWNTDIVHACFAGNGAVLWQYWIDACGCSGDFDYTPQSASVNFTPVSCS